MEGKIWVKLIKKHKIVDDKVVVCQKDKPQKALYQACKELDLSQPIWLDKNERDWQNFALTSFRPEDFIDAVSFDTMQISYIAPIKEKK